MRTNLKSQPAARTHEGAPSPVLSATKQLRRTVMSCLLFEDSFYEDGIESSARMASLIKQVPFADAAQIAIEAREKSKLRHAPLFLVREMLRIHKGRQMGDLIARVIQRPDELGELLALYWKEKKDAPLTAQMKIGLGRALNKFTEYQLAKWDKDSAGVSLKDILFLTHARPRGAEGEGTVAAAIAKPNYRRGEVHRHAGTLLDKIVTGSLATPDTWEVSLSEGADKKATFTRLMEEKKLGALALLRNLRNMIQAGVEEDKIRSALAAMNAERVLPFRFISAAKYAPRLEDALEQAMFRCLAEVPKLAGKTALLIDHSGSMQQPVSVKSEITRFDAAAALAMILRETAERCRVFTFSDRMVEVPPRRGFALVQAVREVINPTSTWLGAAVRKIYEIYPECDRIIVVTDEQSADRPPHPQGHGYIVNVGGNAQGIGYGPWVTIDGWSEAVLDWIRLSEEAESA
jgi:60 kDa SS-A/Ro ribonucleoprotein